MGLLKTILDLRVRQGSNTSPSPPDNWILASGYWNDDGIWNDTKFWIDGEVAPEVPTAKLFSYDAGSQVDSFVDSTFIDSQSGITISVNNPVKSLSNPILETSDVHGVWDLGKNYNSVQKVGSTYKMWYAGDDGNTLVYTCYATSTDGITWDKPNLGLVSFDGNTNNNIILGNGSFNPSVVYDPDGAADRKYVMILEQKVGDVSGGSVYLYKSADGIAWTYIKALSIGEYCESKALIKRPDGKWLAYYVKGHGVNLRVLGAMLSNSTDIEGTWTDQGTVINSTLATAQKYSIGVVLVNDVYYGIVSSYNSTTALISCDLYVSRDALSWTLKKSNWIPLGSSGSWDDGMIIGGKSLIVDDNSFLFYYSGFNEDHATTIGREARVGLATIGYDRIIEIGSNGTLITTAFTPTSGLLLNVNATGTGIQVELLDGTTNAVLSGYSKTDMDAISGDSYSQEITWNSNSIPTNTELKVKFYITNN